MAYQVIARKWRPALFSDVVGQEHVIKTLRGEITSGRTAHAYLFVGPRGVGKTTIARIFAKALNCAKYPSEEPCLECESCRSIAEGGDLDLIEIDGASNNQVDDVRQIREEALYAPVRGRFKIYIIDEAHMLSNNAWNALLKIIEEPPPHVKFFFATTEAHKVPVTVVSRCQRFDLGRITFRQIIGQLRKIAAAEGIKVSDSALEVIARAADGGMRDAQSLLDQMVSFSIGFDGEISEERVLDMFGLVASGEIESLAMALLSDDKPGIVASVNNFAVRGRNMEKLLDDLLAFLRGAHICAIMREPASVLDVGDDILSMYKKAAQAGADAILKLLETLSTAGGRLRNALNKQVYLETELLKAARRARSVDIGVLVEKLGELKKDGKLGSVASAPSVAEPPAVYGSADSADSAGRRTPPPAAPPTSQPPSQRPTPSASSSSRPSSSAPGATQPPPRSAEPPSQAPPPQPAEPARPEQPAESADASRSPEPSNSAPEPAPSPASDGDAPAPSGDGRPPEPSGAIEPELFAKPAGAATAAPTSAQPMTPASPAASPTPAPVQPSASPSPKPIHVLENPKPQQSAASAGQPPASPASVWRAMIKETEHASRTLLKAYMQEGRPEKFDGMELTVVYDEDIDAPHVAALRKERQFLEMLLRRVTRKEGATVNIVVQRGVSSPRLAMAALSTSEQEEIKRKVQSNKFVQDVMSLFDAEIVEVRG